MQNHFGALVVSLNYPQLCNSFHTIENIENSVRKFTALVREKNTRNILTSFPCSLFLMDPFTYQQGNFNYHTVLYYQKLSSCFTFCVIRVTKEKTTFIMVVS